MTRTPLAAAPRLGPCEIVKGDLTKPATLVVAVDGSRDIIFTAGCRSGRLVRESTVRATEYEGVLNTLEAAKKVGFSGRFLYMNSSGVGQHSFWTAALNFYKGNTLVWRERAESAIRASGFRYTIIRTGVLLNTKSRPDQVEVTQEALPLSPKYRIARADVANVFVTALERPRTERTTFEIVWKTGVTRPWKEGLDGLTAD